MPARSLRKKIKTDETGTRERILTAAAPLFAENGFDATGIRAIASAAEVNIAAVNYHFGSKDSLIAAVGERYLKSVNERRLEALAKVVADAPGGKPAVEGVIESFVLREGTEYGEREYSLDEKVAHVMRQLERGEAQILFYPVTETIDIVVVEGRRLRD